jgi:hypothetical protein
MHSLSHRSIEQCVCLCVCVCVCVLCVCVCACVCDTCASKVVDVRMLSVCMVAKQHGGKHVCNCGMAPQFKYVRVSVCVREFSVCVCACIFV